MAYVKVGGKKYKVHEDTRTHVFAILDRSGSMAGMVKDTLGGYNQFIKELEKAHNASVTLTLFDNLIETPYSDVPVEKVKTLTDKVYYPRGMTALVDAVYETLKEYEGNVKTGDKAVVLVITDGQENASHMHSSKELNRLISKLDRKKNWTFTYIGANQDSWASAGEFGFARGNTTNYAFSGAGTRSVYSTVAANTVKLSNSGASNTKEFFSKEDKDKLENAE